MEDLDEKLRRIPKELFLHLGGGGIVGIDVFSSKVDETGNFVKEDQLAEPSTDFNDLITLLREYQGKDVLIKEHCYKQLQKVLESSVTDVIQCENTSVEEKSKLIYECASNVMEDVFADPRSGENINRTRKVCCNIIDFALQSDASIPSLLSLGSHDYYTFTHCINVTVFGIGLWNLIVDGTVEELIEFAMGCMFHDIGKTKISNDILNKPGKLTDEEFEEIKNHPRYGYHLMKDYLSRASLDVILHHHERIDGSGYPEGLTGPMISDNAKIALIADIYDALTTRRSYSDAKKPFNAVLMMKQEMGGFYETDKFVQFIKMLGSY